MSKADKLSDRPQLTVSREEAERRLAEQIKQTEDFLPAGETRVTYEHLSSGHRVWEDYTVDLLRNLFTTDEIANEFKSAGHLSFSLKMSHAEQFRYVVDQTNRQVAKLRSIVGRLEFFEPRPSDYRPIIAIPIQGTAPPGEVQNRVGEVFVVHGHDEATKHAVARLLERLKFKPIILHEQADKGRTIIQKFMDHSGVQFAVVLLTADDVGSAVGAPELKPRARQNVILELGYFLGKLPTGHVCALKAAEVEVPSDLAGVLYLELDMANAWQLRLAREMKAAGLDVDLNLVM